MNWTPAPWTPQLKRNTIVSATVLGLLNAWLFTHAGASLVHELMAVGLLLIIPFASLFLVRSYAIADGHLYIKRLIWTNRYPLDELQRVEIAPDILASSRMLLGNRGFFAYTGFFRHPTLLTYRAWVSDNQRTLILHFANKRWVISPLSPPRFADEIYAQTQTPETVPSTRPPHQAD